MKLFLIRHADAIDLADDAARPLSELGWQQSVALGRRLGEREDFSPAVIWHSPLVRTRQTSEGLLEGLGRPVPLRLIEGLKPEDDPREIAAMVGAEALDLVIIGHEPHLGILGGLLAYGKEGPSLIFRKSCGYVFNRRAAGPSPWKISDAIGPGLP